MNTGIGATRVWCCDCEKEHPAHIYEENNSIICTTACPRKEKNVTLSNDASLWKALREKSYFDPALKTGIPGGVFVPGVSPPLPEPGKNQCSNRGIRLYRLDITNACNFHCPICYANADGDSEQFFIDIKNVEEAVRSLRQEGAKEITFTGGEPTIHPELETFIAVFRKAGIKPAILTNGLRIAQEAGYARRLKKSGLRRAYIQFDTLTPAVHEKMRGNTLLEEKKKALLECRKAKIKTSVIAVIIKDNLHETGALVDYMRNIVPWFGEIVFVTAIRETGRFDVPWDSFVYKEDIIKSLVKTAAITGISADNFYPLPVCRPLGLNSHPGSNIVLPLVFMNGKIELLENFLDIKKFFSLLNGETNTKDSLAAMGKAILFFLASLKYKKIPALVRILFGYLTKIGRTYINYVLIQNFLSKDFQDLQCLDNCNAYHAGPNGKFSSVCIYNQDFKSGHLWTKYSPS